MGAFHNLVVSILLFFALEEGGSKFQWNSAAITANFVLSGIKWIASVWWEGVIGYDEECLKSYFR